MRGPIANRCRIGANSVRQISDCLLSCAEYIPREFPRKCRSLLDVDRWKATEFRQFVIYTGMVVLKGKIDVGFYNHFLLFCVSIYCLSSPLLCVTYNDFVDQLLLVFVRQWGEYYGRDMLVYNVHNIVHLSSDALKFGPLDSYSAFPFESFLGRIKKMIRNPLFPLQQIIRRLSERKNGGSLESIEITSILEKSGFVGCTTQLKVVPIVALKLVNAMA
jgi:hypothetical protein